MFVITGPGRSGTSLLAEYFHRIGHDIGGHELLPVSRYGHEAPEVAQINETLMARHLEAWKHRAQDVPDVPAAIRTVDRSAIKDPRITYHPAIFKAWTTHRDDLAFLVTLRNPRHVAASWRLHGAAPPEPRVIRDYMAAFLAALRDWGGRYALVSFPRIVDDWPHLARALDVPALEDVWQGLARADYVRFRQQNRRTWK